MTDIRETIEAWRRNLLDLTKRNTLVNCRIGSRGAVSIAHPDAEEIWQRISIGDGSMTFAHKDELVPAEEELDETVAAVIDAIPDRGELFPVRPARKKHRNPPLDDCLDSPYLADDQLIAEMSDRELELRLRRLSLRAKESLSEQGVHSLFLGFGLLKWYESNDSEVELFSPLMLVPVNVQQKTTDSPWTVSEYEDDAIPNYCLGELLKSQFGIELPELPPLADLEAAGARTDFLDRVRDAIQDSPRWEVIDAVVLNNFTFQKIAMWRDLGDNWEQIANHNVCQAVAGDESSAVSDSVDLPSPEEFDEKVPPMRLHTILDSDSSQLEAILAVKEGMSIVLDGPPGTGKSQTIANLIAEFLAAGKSVLFVSEKSAALEVVKRRLDNRKLGDFCLECHSHKANKKAVVTEIARCLHLPREVYPDQRQALEELYVARNRLNWYVRALHRRREPLGMTAYQAHGCLARVDRGPSSRCAIEDPAKFTGQQLRDIHDLLRKLADCKAVIDGYAQHPWKGCRLQGQSLSIEDDVRHHFSALAASFRRIADELQPLVDHGLIASIPSPTDLASAMKELDELRAVPPIPADWLNRDPRAVAVNVIKLANSAADEADFRQRLSQYVDDIEQRFPADAVPLLLYPGDDWSRLVRPHAERTIRTQIEYFSRLLSGVLELKQSVLQLDDAVKNVMACLSVPLSTEPTIQLLARLVELGNLISTSGALRRSWFEAARRAEIRSIASKCLADVNEVEPIRRELIERMSHRAFEPESKALADRSLPYERIWKRWFGGFRAFKRELQDIYIDDMPTTTKALLADMSRLRRFHRRMEVVHRHEREIPDDLAQDSDNKTDWQRILDGLDAVERLTAFIKVPRNLIDALCSPDRIDREALAKTVRCLEELLRTQKDEWELLDQRVAVRFVGENRTLYESVPVSVLSDWLGTIATLLGTRLVDLDRVQEVLRSGEDVSVDSLDEHRELANSLYVAVRSVKSASNELRDLSVVIEPAAAAKESYAAEWLLDSVNRYGPELPTAVRIAATSQDARDKLNSARSNVKAAVDDRFRESWEFLKRAFDIKTSVADGTTVATEPVSSLADWLGRRTSDLASLWDWMRFRQIESDLREKGVGEIVNELLSGDFTIESARDAFDASFYRKWLDAIYQSDEDLRDFDVSDHERLIARFADLDRQSIRNAYCRIRSRLLDDPDRPHADLQGAPSSSELGTLLRECNKKTRHLPLRVLFQRIPNMLLRLKPCVMMSPLAVSTYLNTDQLRFDLVIFDEASQVRPFDAIGAIYRGRQLVVAGDQKQMPPTTFFDRMGSEEEFDEGEEETGIGNIQDFESILDVCLSMGMPRKRLRWHYRSKREQLIAFSNHHFYDNDLVTFPSVQDGDGARAVEHVFVEGGCWKSGSSGGFNDVEARRTVELIFRHFEDFPDRSLGVVTFNQRQQLAVIDYLHEALKHRPDMEELCAETAAEPLFIKNLENVQGDERDVILLSMAYGPDQHGRFYKRFGPLNRQGGERRLNVAVTRARERIIFVSSVRSQDLDLSSSVAVGPRLLKHYIEYAERGVAALGTERVENADADFDSPFEAEVFAELERRGFEVRRQVGCGGYRIDLAIVHPEHPGRFILGIECDGVTYHSSRTARDRDRLRQSVLEQNLGWTMVRIWSTDWVRNRERQIQRVITSYEASLSADSNGGATDSDELDPSVESLQPTIVERIAIESSVSLQFNSIDSVPNSVIDELAHAALSRLGAMQRDDLVRQISRDLGFQRSGNRIRSRIEIVIDGCVNRGVVLRQSDGRLVKGQ